MRQFPRSRSNSGSRAPQGLGRDTRSKIQQKNSKVADTCSKATESMASASIVAATGGTRPDARSGTIVGSLHCDCCGAGITMGAKRCDYCGQVPIILLKGVKFSVLLSMYLDAGRFPEAQELSSELLKEHPQNALAWAGKGLSVLHGACGKVAADDVASAVKCFDIASEIGSGLVESLRGCAAQLCLDTAASWGTRWTEAYSANSFVPLMATTKSAFVWVHVYALAAEKLNPAMKDAVGKMLRSIDDMMEQRFEYLFTAENYQERRRPKRHTQKRVSANANSGELWWTLFGLIGLLWVAYRLFRH